MNPGVREILERLEHDARHLLEAGHRLDDPTLVRAGVAILTRIDLLEQRLSRRTK